MIAKKILAAATIFFVAFFLGKTAAFGEGAGCNLSAVKFNQLKSLEENSPNYTEAIKNELPARKALLKETINCAAGEASNIRSKLSGAGIDDADLKKVKGQLLEQLAGAVNYYELRSSEIDDLGLQGSKDFAKNLMEWRKGNYEPGARTAGNLIIWAGNHNILQISQNRMNQLSHAIDILKLLDNEEIQGIWKGAQDNFASALNFNQQAKLGFLGLVSADDTLLNIKSSLEALAKTYGKFFDLVKILNTEAANK